MDYKEIKKIIDDMGNSKIDSLDIEFPDGTKVSMKKNQTEVKEVEQKEKTKVQQIIESGEEINKEENLKSIKSPMVGTFYNSPSPKESPFVKVGDKVKKGDVLCVIEAMKLMNEIESEYDGEIAEICVNNEEMVEYGSLLFKIK